MKAESNPTRRSVSLSQANSRNKRLKPIPIDPIHTYDLYVFFLVHPYSIKRQSYISEFTEPCNTMFLT